MLVEIRPIEKDKWHKKKGAEDFSVAKKLMALVDAKTLKYSTGLSKEDRIRLEKELNVDLSDNFKHDTPHPFWDSINSTLSLENRTIFLNTNNAMEFIKLSIAKASRFVANSTRELEKGLFPDATHVIFNEREENEVKAKKIEIKYKAIEEVSKLSKDKKIEIVLILNGKNLKGQSDNFVNVAINSLIEKKAEEVLRWVNNKDKLFISNYALVLECLQKSVLRKNGHKIMYYDSNLGSDEMVVAEYLGKDENQEIKIRLMEQVNT